MSVPPEVLAALEQIASGATPRTLESETLEFKTQGRSDRDALLVIAEAAACLANAHGAQSSSVSATGSLGRPASKGAPWPPAWCSVASSS